MVANLVNLRLFGRCPQSQYNINPTSDDKVAIEQLCIVLFLIIKTVDYVSPKVANFQSNTGPT